MYFIQTEEGLSANDMTQEHVVIDVASRAFKQARRFRFVLETAFNEDSVLRDAILDPETDKDDYLLMAANIAEQGGILRNILLLGRHIDTHQGMNVADFAELMRHQILERFGGTVPDLEDKHGFEFMEIVLEFIEQQKLMMNRMLHQSTEASVKSLTDEQLAQQMRIKRQRKRFKKVMVEPQLLAYALLYHYDLFMELSAIGGEIAEYFNKLTLRAATVDGIAQFGGLVDFEQHVQDNSVEEHLEKAKYELGELSNNHRQMFNSTNLKRETKYAETSLTELVDRYLNHETFKFI